MPIGFPGPQTQSSVSKSEIRRQILKVGAVCGSFARTDLRGEGLRKRLRKSFYRNHRIRIPGSALPRKGGRPCELPFTVPYERKSAVMDFVDSIIPKVPSRQIDFFNDPISAVDDDDKVIQIMACKKSPFPLSVKIRCFVAGNPIGETMRSVVWANFTVSGPKQRSPLIQ